MAITLGAHTTAGAPSATATITTSSIDTSGASLLVVVLSDYRVTGPATITDSKSNTWLTRTAFAVANSQCQIVYAVNPTVGAGHTFTASLAGNTFPTICVAAFNGVTTVSPYDVENGNSSGSNTVLSTGSVTPSENNELLIAGFTFENSGTASINGSFTITDQTNFSSGAHFGGALAYKIQTSAGAENPQWSTTGAASSLATAIATFKAAAVTTADPPFSISQPSSHYRTDIVTI